MASSTTLNNQSQHYNNDGGSAPDGGITAMASDASLVKNKQKGKSLEIIDTEEIFLPSGGTIIEKYLYVTLDKQKNSSQKDG